MPGHHISCIIQRLKNSKKKTKTNPIGTSVCKLYVPSSRGWGQRASEGCQRVPAPQDMGQSSPKSTLTYACPLPGTAVLGGPPTPVPVGGNVPLLLQSLQDLGGVCSTDTPFLFSQQCRWRGDTPKPFCQRLARLGCASSLSGQCGEKRCPPRGEISCGWAGGMLGTGPGRTGWASVSPHRLPMLDESSGLTPGVPVPLQHPARLKSPNQHPAAPRPPGWSESGWGPSQPVGPESWAGCRGQGARADPRCAAGARCWGRGSPHRGTRFRGRKGC